MNGCCVSIFTFLLGFCEIQWLEATRPDFFMSRSSRINPRIAASIFILMGVVSLSGCCALPWRCPSGEEVIAAREQGRLGMDALARGQLHEAELRLQMALQECPCDDQLRRDYAQILWELGRRDEARQAMQQVVQSSKGDAPAGGEAAWMVEYGRMLLADGDLTGALQAVDKALHDDPQAAVAWKLRGDVMRLTNHLSEAVANYHRALSVGGDASSTLLDLADVYRLQNRPRRALATLQRLYDTVTPENRPQRLAGMQAAALQALGRHEDAIEHFSIAVDKEQQNPELLYLMAVSQSQAGFYQSAAETAQRAAALQPFDTRIRTLMASLEAKLPTTNSRESRVVLTSSESPLSD